MNSKFLVSSCIAILLTTSPVSADKLGLERPFAFVDQFPNVAKDIGFATGRRLSIGFFVIPGEHPVSEVSMENLKTGVTLKPSSKQDISEIFAREDAKPVLFTVLPMPAFDADKHLGVWRATVKDESGYEVVANTHELDKLEEMPFLDGFRASGDPLTPSISWNAPDPDMVPDGCETEYRVRLLKSITDQLHRSDVLIEERYDIPDGILKSNDIADTFVRVEFTCSDSSENHPVSVELRSETFIPLEEIVE